MEKVLLQFEAHGHGGAHCNARCSPFSLKFASEEPPGDKHTIRDVNDFVGNIKGRVTAKSLVYELE